MVSRLLAVVAFIAFAVVVFWNALVHTVHSGTLALPEFRGMTVEQAEQHAHDSGIELVVEEPGVFSAATPPGLIADQNPFPGFHVKVGSPVAVRLSLGSERTTIPELLGESLQGGLRGLEQVGLKPGRRIKLDGQGSGDRIIATDPRIGRETAPDSAIDLLINVTPAVDLWVMPSLLSRSQEATRRFCLNNQLRLGQIHQVAYPGLPRGLVLRQYPPAGSPLSRSDIITVWVSR
jgi:beta-lactam-binding protein with PASTA domain